MSIRQNRSNRPHTRRTVAVAFGLTAAATVAQADPTAEFGAKLYQERCAACHEGAVPEAPRREAMAALSPEAIRRALTDGVMQAQAAGLNRTDIAFISQYVAAGAVTTFDPASHSCPGELRLDGATGWNRWGNGLDNRRFQPAAVSGLTAANVERLELKWAFGFPGATRARSQPTIAGDVLFTGSQDGTVYALDTKTGCIWWTFRAGAEVRNAVTVRYGDDNLPDSLYFGDFAANVYRIDAATGRLRWRSDVSDHPAGTITGSVTFAGDQLFVPMSSTEVISAYDPAYNCCTFRGGVLALNADSGERQWRFYTVDEPQPQARNSEGRQLYGPSGAPVWSTPTVDEARGLVYVGTGENYSSPANELSDAILAIDRSSGELRWARQVTRGDAWNAACGTTVVNCPEEDGPDFDFGAPPILTATPAGDDILLAGQKSGVIYALDPDDAGRILWQWRAGMGGFNGGVHWGMASDGVTLFAAIADTPGHRQTTGDPRPGLHAYDVARGVPIWSRYEYPVCQKRDYRCYPALSAAITLTPGVVFAGGLDGTLHAYSAETGAMLWQFETERAFETVNDVAARGGSIDSDGPVVVGGRLYVNSGYDKFGEIPGNVLLAFGLPED